MEILSKIFLNIKQVSKNFSKSISHITTSVFKNKRFFILILLFFVLSGIIIPKIVTAGYHPACWEWAWGKATPGTYRNDLCAAADANYKAVANIAGDPAKVFATGLLLFVISAIISATGALASMSATLLSTVLGTTSAVCYTCFDNKVIATGWPIVQNLANMIVVLGFVVIALATILRFQDYEAKKLLPKLIGAAILINFSLVICGVFIDGSNIVTDYFIKGDGGFFEKSAVKNVTDQLTEIWAGWDTNNSSMVIAKAVSAVFYNIMLTIVFLLFFFLFIMRYLMLWILVILSPLAFVFYVFPFTNQYFKMWWNNFFQWCIIGAPAAFFIYLSGKMTENFLTKNSTATSASGTGLEMLGYLVPSFFLIAGFLFSLKTGAMGANMITSKAGNYFNKGKAMLGGAGMGALKGTANKVADVTGVSKATKYMQNQSIRAGEAMGFVPKGTYSQRTKESTKKEYDRLSSMPMKDLKAYKDKLGSQRLPYTASQQKEMSAIGRILVEEGEFDTNNKAAKAAVPAWAV